MLARRYLTVLNRTEARPQEELKRLTDLVNKAYVGRDGRHLRDEFWYQTGFLPKTIVNKRGIDEETFPYILRHTMRRPRDLITAQMQKIVNEAVKNGEFPYISAASVVAGVHDQRALHQILLGALAPYEDNFPAALVNAARAAFYKRSPIMTGRELKVFAKELYSLKALKNIEPEKFVEILLQCGVVGLKEEQPAPGDRTGAPRPYCIARFEHLMEGNLPLTDRLVYCVHPVMANAFNMASTGPEGVIYPMPTDDVWLEGAASIL